METKKVLAEYFEKALTIQEPVIAAQVERIKRTRPSATPRQVAVALERYYLSTVTTTGAAAGAAALAPGVGVPAALLDTLAFTEASVAYILARAHIHGINANDIERRRALVLTILVGDSGSKFVAKTVDRTGKHWARALVSKVPMSAINKINAVMGPRFVTKYGTKQGVLVLGKQVPFGMGALIGGSGNHVFGRIVTREVRKAFGPPPDSWPPNDGGDDSGSDHDPSRSPDRPPDLGIEGAIPPNGT